jgi:hypothetical protein
MDLSWEGDEPATAVAEEEVVPPTEESAPAPQAEPEAPAAEATLPEASVVEGEYSAQVRVAPRSSRSRQVRLIHLSFRRQVLKPREAISHRRCPLKMWHRRLRELPEEPPS